MKWKRDGIAVIYARASDPGKQEHSVADQIAAGRKWAADNGLVVVAVFVDDRQGKSKGIDRNRPGLKKLVEFLVEHPEKGVVIVWHRDRLARPKFHGDARKGFEIPTLYKHGWWIELLTGSKLTGDRKIDDMAAFMEYSQCGMDGHYLPRSKRIGFSMRKRALEGGWNGGPIPYARSLEITGATGTRIVPRGTPYSLAKGERARLVAGDPGEVEAVGLLLSLYLGEGLGIGKIRAALKRRGIPSPSGKPTWPYSSVHGILRNPAYGGTYVYNRGTRAEYCRITKDGPEEKPYEELGEPTSTLLPNAREHWVEKEGVHEPLVPATLIERASKRLASRGNNGGRNHDYLLTGCESLIFCANCPPSETTGKPYALTGRHRSVKNAAGGRTHYYYYKCTGRIRQEVCHGYSVHQVPFDRAVRRKVWELIAPLATARKAQLRKMLIKELRAGGGNAEADSQRAAVASSEKQLAKLKADIDQCDENLARAGSERAQRRLEAKLEAWEAKQADIEAELAKLKADTPPETSVEERADRHLALLDQFPQNAEKAPVGAQKAFFMAALDGIEVLWDPKRPRNKKFVKATMRLSADLTRLTALASSIRNGDPVRERVEARRRAAGGDPE